MTPPLAALLASFWVRYGFVMGSLWVRFWLRFFDFPLFSVTYGRQAPKKNSFFAFFRFERAEVQFHETVNLRIFKFVNQPESLASHVLPSLA